jgi:hypothetical protein
VNVFISRKVLKAFFKEMVKQYSVESS